MGKNKKWKVRKVNYFWYGSPGRPRMMIYAIVCVIPHVNYRRAVRMMERSKK